MRQNYLFRLSFTNLAAENRICRGFFQNIAHKTPNFLSVNEKRLIFAPLFVSKTPLGGVARPEAKAQMAESVDALVSNTSGATRAGSTPALGTTQVLVGSILTRTFLIIGCQRVAKSESVCGRCVIIANLLRCYRIRAWSCTSVHSLCPHPQRLAS